MITVERAPGQAYGMTANSFCSVSLEPLLVLVCVDERSHLLPLLKEKGAFGVSVLREEQQPLSAYFAQPVQTAEADSKLGVRFRWAPSPLGRQNSSANPPEVPLVEDTITQLVCCVVATYSAGDHTIFLGEVHSADLATGEPLVFFRSQYRRLAPAP